jgi:hypothetical protein
MTITELALLRLSQDLPITDTTLLANLAAAKRAMKSFTSLPFYFYHCIEDPALIYILGSWCSLSQHMESWIPSPGNLALLQLLKDQVRVEWMFHVDVDPSTLPRGAPVLGIARYIVPKDSEGRFGEFLNNTKHSPANRVGGEQLVRGGWRIEKHDEGQSRKSGCCSVVGKRCKSI